MYSIPCTLQNYIAAITALLCIILLLLLLLLLYYFMYECIHMFVLLYVLCISYLSITCQGTTDVN